MLEMIKARKEREEKGFTLAELLIVVAIIAVLIAIAIPVFATQLEKSREATDQANVRSAYAQVTTEYLTNADTGYSMKVKARQTQSGWQGPKGTITIQVDGKESTRSFAAKTTGSSYNVKISKSGKVSVN